MGIGIEQCYIDVVVYCVKISNVGVVKFGDDQICYNNFVLGGLIY